MNVPRSKAGFTLLELMVATLLFGMLCMILTMVFNQSAIAWRTGSAVVSDLNNARRGLAQAQELADNAFRRGSTTYRYCSAWDENGELRRRAFRNPDSTGGFSVDDVSTWRDVSVGVGDGADTMRSWTVGVTSAGPDKDFSTEYDNVTSWPEGVK